MAKIILNKLTSEEIVPGFHVKFVHSKNMTVAFWDIEAGASLQVHSHEHEQVSTMLEGEFELTLDGKVHLLKKNEVLIIPSNTPHSGKALTHCRIQDVFYPIRKDYQ